MKTVSSIILSLALAAGATAAEPSHHAKILKIEGQDQKTPQFQISGPREKVVKSREWIEIEADVKVETTDPTGFIPELQASWYAVIIGKDKKPVRLMGKSVFKNISVAEGMIHLSAYIEPETLERLTGNPRAGARDIEAYALTLSGPGIVEGKYAEDLVMATDKEKDKWWLEWKYESLEGSIIPKSETPFAPLWTDRYPAEKLAKN